MNGVQGALGLAVLAAAAAAATEIPFVDAGGRAGLGEIRAAARELGARVTAEVQESEALTLWRGRETQAVVSREYVVPPFDRAVVSWNTTGPAVIELEVGGQWHVMARWSDEPRSGTDPEVKTDTLELKTPADRFRFRVTPRDGAAVTLVGVAHWKKGFKRALSRERSAAWGRTIDVPQRSQATARTCSPTSLAMVLDHYGAGKPTDEVAEGVLDHQADVYGNWPFNTAYAHSVSGLEAYVRRMSNLDELEQEIAEGRPVILSHKFERGDLDGAPISRTDGHIIVVVGFTKDGDVVVNDPAGRRGGVRRVYKRAQIYKTWLERASGVVYVLRRA